jgi:hypothetical protein
MLCEKNKWTEALHKKLLDIMLFLILLHINDVHVWVDQIAGQNRPQNHLLLI